MPPSYRLTGKPTATLKRNRPDVLPIKRCDIVNDVSIWENIPTNVKQDLRSPQKLKRAHVTRKGAGIARTGRQSYVGMVLNVEGLAGM
jgi:hypothetical protein